MDTRLRSSAARWWWMNGVALIACGVALTASDSEAAGPMPGGGKRRIIMPRDQVARRNLSFQAYSPGKYYVQMVVRGHYSGFGGGPYPKASQNFENFSNFVNSGLTETQQTVPSPQGKTSLAQLQHEQRVAEIIRNSPSQRIATLEETAQHVLFDMSLARNQRERFRSHFEVAFGAKDAAELLAWMRPLDRGAAARGEHLISWKWLLPQSKDNRESFSGRMLEAARDAPANIKRMVLALSGMLAANSNHTVHVRQSPNGRRTLRVTHVPSGAQVIVAKARALKMKGHRPPQYRQFVQDGMPTKRLVFIASGQGGSTVELDLEQQMATNGADTHAAWVKTRRDSFYVFVVAADGRVIAGRPLPAQLSETTSNAFRLPGEREERGRLYQLDL